MHEDLADSQRLGSNSHLTRWAWWTKWPAPGSAVLRVHANTCFSLPNGESEFEWFTHSRSRWAMETLESVLIFLSALILGSPPMMRLHLMFSGGKWLNMSSYGPDSEVTSSHEWKTALSFSSMASFFPLSPGGNVHWYSDAKEKTIRVGIWKFKKVALAKNGLTLVDLYFF